jgi:hypothetical protein
MVYQGDRIVGCNSFDSEVEFFFSTLKEIVEENLQPIKTVLTNITQHDTCMATDWKKAESERTANLRAWGEIWAEKERERQFQLEQIRNARPVHHEASGNHQDCVSDRNREASGNHQGCVNDRNREMFNPPLCENNRDRELLDTQASRRKGQSSNIYGGRPESALVPPDQSRYAIDNPSFWTEVRTSRNDLSDASFWSDLRREKSTVTTIEEVDTQFGKEIRGAKGRSQYDSIGKVDTTFWEEKTRGEKGYTFTSRSRSAALQEIDTRAWHVFKYT